MLLLSVQVIHFFKMLYNYSQNAAVKLQTILVAHTIYRKSKMVFEIGHTDKRMAFDQQTVDALLNKNALRNGL